MSMPLGLVEGFYGRTYSWSERRELVTFLASRGYDHYFYAPKADACLRSDWTRKHDPRQVRALRAFGAHCKRQGLTWGIGLSPLTAGGGGPFDERSSEDLLRRVDELEALSIDHLLLLFDDMHGHEGLAERQCAMVDRLRRTFPLRLIVCPTYYSTSSVLDRIFGQRPVRYLEQLGQGLDPSVEVLWTGPKVCSESYPNEHLAEVAGALNRRPWIWDNYPVNDGPRMCGFLHLLGFPPRTRQLRERVAGISVNPMSQPWLSRLPLATLPDALNVEQPMDRREAFLESGSRLLPGPLFAVLREDLDRFQSAGLDGLAPAEVTGATDTYSRFDHPVAREIVSWLRGDFRVEGESVAG
jgi:hyaluronoglucosaminidase